MTRVSINTVDPPAPPPEKRVLRSFQKKNAPLSWVCDNFNNILHWNRFPSIVSNPLENRTYSFWPSLNSSFKTVTLRSVNPPLENRSYSFWPSFIPSFKTITLGSVNPPPTSKIEVILSGLHSFLPLKQERTPKPSPPSPQATFSYPLTPKSIPPTPLSPKTIPPPP